MITYAAREPKIRLKDSYSIFTVLEQLSVLIAHPSKFANERKGYEELSRLVFPLIMLALFMSLIIVPSITYLEIKDGVTTAYYESLGESEIFPSSAVNEELANREINQITMTTIRYMISEKWVAVLLAGLIIIPLYALVLLIFFFLRALIRYAYLQIWGSKGILQKHLTLEAYYALLWGPIGVIILLLSIAMGQTSSLFGAVFLLILILVITLWNWHVYVSSISSLHYITKGKTFLALFLPFVLSIILIGLSYMVLLGMAATVLKGLGA
jgi:hypothetical protein